MTKKQHYIPQFYLKNFTNGRGKLWVYDRLENRYFECAPKDICYKKYLYETQWEEANPRLGEYLLPNQIEKSFSRYEGEYSALSKRVNSISCNPENKKALICNKDEKRILARFIANMLLRNPWCMEHAKLNSVDDGILDVEEIATIDRILQDMKFGGIKSIVRFASKKVWLDEEFEGGMVQKAISEIYNLNFCVLVANEYQFVTSEFPVIWGRTNVEEEIKERVIYFPLSPQVAIFYTDNISPNFRNKIVSVLKSDVSNANQQYLKYSVERSRFIFSKEKMILQDIVTDCK